jgi:hypothetical protein
MLRSAANVQEGRSLANRFRARRFARFEQLAARLPRPLSILDIGGTPEFWQHRGWAGRDDCRITLVNLTPRPSRHANVVSLAGDATDLGCFATGEFDIAFSNSVIEHLESFDAQRAMAGEVERVGRAYWVQTPNYWFPVEPHFLVPGWQWLPEGVRCSIIRRFRCGWRGPYPDPADARRAVREIRLITRSELEALFPGASFWGERFLGLVKSWVAHRGFDSRTSPGAVAPVACSGAPLREADRTVAQGSDA